MIAEKSRGIVDDSCHGCIYLGVTTNTCDYILMESRLRPCPAGKGCTVRRTRKGGGKIKKPKWDTELGRLLWLDGRKDSKIADEFGIATSVVTAYRKRHWEKGSQKPAPVVKAGSNVPEGAPEEPEEVAIVEETKQENTEELDRLRSEADALVKRCCELNDELDQAREERAYWKHMYEEEQLRRELFSEPSRDQAEKLVRLETMNASLKEENLVLRHQLDIVYLIFGSRHVAGLREDI